MKDKKLDIDKIWIFLSGSSYIIMKKNLSAHCRKHFVLHDLRTSDHQIKCELPLLYIMKSCGLEYLFVGHSSHWNSHSLT